MGLIEGWASGWGRRSNARAVANARGAATLASRRRVETAEVAAYLASRAAAGAHGRDPGRRGARGPIAWTV